MKFHLSSCIKNSRKLHFFDQTKTGWIFSIKIFPFLVWNFLKRNPTTCQTSLPPSTVPPGLGTANASTTPIQPIRHGPGKIHLLFLISGLLEIMQNGRNSPKGCRSSSRIWTAPRGWGSEESKHAQNGWCGKWSLKLYFLLLCYFLFRKLVI